MKLSIEKVIYGGHGLARIPEGSGALGGMRVFVPFTLPQEIVEAKITEEHRGYCVGEAQQIERASEFRVDPPCPFFGTCGGCQLQHSVYSHQVEMKRAMLVESLTRAGVRALPPISAISGEALGYRNRVRLRVQSKPEFALGYRQEKSHRMVVIDRCPIAAPLLERCIAVICELGQINAVPLDMQEMEIFTNHDQSAFLMTMWVHPQTRFQQNSYVEFLQKLQKEIPQLHGAAVFAQEKETSHTGWPLLQWGQKSLLYRVAGREYTVSLGSFFQVNCTLLDTFVAAVVGDESGHCAWELYAGVGLFSLALTQRFERVVAVESSRSACKDLRKNLQGTNAQTVSSTTLHFLQQAVKRGEDAPDLILLDPPRAGVGGVEACDLLARCNARRIIYVSCDPATLGRDLAALVQSGYRLQRLQFVDMFPQTHHLETIATLQR